MARCRSSATFEVGADTTTLALTTEDDAPIEDPSTVTVTIEAGARYQAAAGADTADAVVLDDLPRFLLKVGPAEVTEGGGGAVTVEIDNGVSLATAQTISLTLSGTATADDFTLLNTSDRRFRRPTHSPSRPTKAWLRPTSARSTTPCRNRRRR